MDADAFADGDVDVDVVVVGGGPVGLFLAAELGLAGASAAVVEKTGLSARANSPALRGVTTRTMRTLALRGLERPVVRAAEQALRELIGTAAGLNPDRAPQDDVAGQVTSTRLGTGGGTKGHIGMVPLTDPAGEFPDVSLLPVPYAALREVFFERARGHGVRLVEGRTVVDVEPGPHGVTAYLDDGRAIRARYLVGADGGRSVVRRLAGFDFPGTDPTLLAVGGEDVTLLDPEKLPHGFTRTPHGALMINVVPGQLVAIEFDAPPADRLSVVTQEELQAALRRVSGTDVTVSRVRSPFRYSDNARQSSTYRRGRVLLAGDAAHVHSPFGGQGVNLGIQDAANLGWKLARVIRGSAPCELLDTYTAERHPVAARVLRNSRAQAALLRHGPQVDALRELFADLVELPQAKTMLIEMLHALDIVYDQGAPAAHPLVGTFAADLAFAGAGNDTCLADGRALLLDAVGSSALREAVAGREDVRWARGSRPDHSGPAALLVRPDGYVAWAGDPGDEQSSLYEALDHWFGPRAKQEVQTAVPVG
ncbi:FAD-dependent monooxygenase [Streptomyces sp. NPDC002088]|uniref:FAD-dependent monooxygenase n=1 Tax=Streptomyces sp. NPDC002088 TaxID=3154665 RepID=UPI0033308675